MLMLSGGRRFIADRQALWTVGCGARDFATSPPQPRQISSRGDAGERKKKDHADAAPLTDGLGWDTAASRGNDTHSHTRARTHTHRRKLRQIKLRVRLEEKPCSSLTPFTRTSSSSMSLLSIDVQTHTHRTRAHTHTHRAIDVPARVQCVSVC